MSAITWTPEELTEFDRITEDWVSRDQMTRISARIGMHSFVEKHGSEKCDAMWAHILAAERK